MSSISFSFEFQEAQGGVPGDDRAPLDADDDRGRAKDRGADDARQAQEGLQVQGQEPAKEQRRGGRGGELRKHRGRRRR